MATRPIIAVTGPDRGGLLAWLFIRWALRRAGARAVRVSPSRGPPAQFDGLVIGGGADVAPDRYGAERAAPAATSYRRSRTRLRLVVDYALAPMIYLLRRLFGRTRRDDFAPDPARDDLELAMIARADTAGVPVLGICRGAQLLNVHAGGTLHQDLSTFYVEHPSPWTVFPRTRVEVAPDSRLADALCVVECHVNSLHRQAVDRLGVGLRAVARDAAGIVQAIEDQAGRFWIGVQWHPEYLPQVAEQRRLLRALVSATARAPRSLRRCTPPAAAGAEAYPGSR